MRKGIFNAGTGKARSFNAIAQALIENLGRGRIRVHPLPQGTGRQGPGFTQADLTTLRAAGYDKPLTELEDGIRKTLAELK